MVKTSLFAWCNPNYPPLMVTGHDNGSSRSSSIRNAPLSTSPPNGSGDPSGSGSTAVPPNDDDVSTNSMNVAENINGVMGPESSKTANRNRDGQLSYASTDRKAPLVGEHLLSRQPITDKRATRRCLSVHRGRSASHLGKSTNGSWTEKCLQP